jgi:transcription elongation factor S-II
MESIDKYQNGVEFTYDKTRYISVDKDGEYKITDTPTLSGDSPAPQLNNIQENPLRYFVRARFREFFENDIDSDRLETAIFNYTIDISKKLKGVELNWKSILFKRHYKQKFISIMHNLADEKNVSLLERISLGEILIEHIPYLSPYELNPELWKPLFDKLGKDNDMGEFAVIAEEGMFKCGKCKSRRVHHYQMQTRSADESMTTYCTCTECKHVWKF